LAIKIGVPIFGNQSIAKIYRFVLILVWIWLVTGIPAADHLVEAVQSLEKKFKQIQTPMLVKKLSLDRQVLPQAI
jgi:hypothetical protein